MSFEKPPERNYAQELGSLPPGFEKTFRVGDVKFKFWAEEDGMDPRGMVHVTSVHNSAETPEGTFGPSGWTDTKVIHKTKINDHVREEVENWENWKERQRVSEESVVEE